MGGDLEKTLNDDPQKGLSPSQWHQRYQQQARWTANIRAYLFKQASLHSSDRVLEVGVGTGAVLDVLSKELSIKPFGLDINRSSLDYAATLNQTFRLVQADGNWLPFANHSFQLAYCHYLLLWVKDPVLILEEMQRVTQPGGYIVALAEPDHKSRIDYPPPLDELGKMQTKALAEQGADTALGRRLRALFESAEISGVEVGILGAQWKGNQSQPEKSEWMMLKSDLRKRLSEEQLHSFQEIDQAAYQNGERVLYIPTFYAIGRVP